MLNLSLIQHKFINKNSVMTTTNHFVIYSNMQNHRYRC